MRFMARSRVSRHLEIIALLYELAVVNRSRRPRLRFTSVDRILWHRLLTPFITYYMRSRTHLALEKDASISRPIMLSSVGRIVVPPHVGGLHHRYDRAAA